MAKIKPGDYFDIGDETLKTWRRLNCLESDMTTVKAMCFSIANKVKNVGGLQIAQDDKIPELEKRLSSVETKLDLLIKIFQKDNQ